MKNKTKHRPTVRMPIMLVSIIGTVLALTISIFFMFDMASKTVEENYRKMAGNNLLAIDTMTELQLDRLVDMIRERMLDHDYLAALSSEPTTQGIDGYSYTAISDMGSAMSGLKGAYNEIVGVYTFDTYGRQYNYLYSRDAPVSYAGAQSETQEWYQSAIQANGREVFRNGNVLNEKEDDCFTIVKSLRSTKNFENLAVAVIVVDKSFFQRVLKEFGQSTPIVILDDQDYIVSILNDNGEMETIASLYLEGESSGYLIMEERLHAPKWIILTGAATNQLEKKNSFFLACVLILAISLLGMEVLLSMVLAKVVYRPLDQLKKAIKAMEVGSEPMNRTFDRGEIGHLGRLLQEKYNTNLELQNKIAEIGLSEKKAELLLLQAQINPHYLYNTLDSVYALALKHNTMDIAEMISALSDMFRVSLSGGKYYLQVKEEIQYLQNYILIMNQRFSNRFSVDYEIDDDVLDCYTIKFILQPFVENAILHGLEPNLKKGSIVISGEKEENLLIFKIYDDGVGMDEDTMKHPGYGIQNVMDRIHLVYGEEYGVSMVSALGEGSVITITIPDRSQSFFEGLEREK